MLWWVAGKTAVILYGLQLRLGVGSFSTEAKFVAHYVGLFQWGIGLVAGWIISYYRKERAAMWVWVLPAIYMLCSVLLWRSPSASVLTQTHLYDGVKHYFSGPCLALSAARISADCAERIFVTGMLYCSVSYSLGALLEAKHLLRRFVSRPLDSSEP